MPQTEDIFSGLGADVFFSKFDFTKGFWQIPMKAEDKPKTAFITPEGSYQFMKMSFGLVNATATYNRMMRKLLQSISSIDSFVDDALAHNQSWEEHLTTLRKLLLALCKASLTMRPKKYQIGFMVLDFVRHRVGVGYLVLRGS